MPVYVISKIATLPAVKRRIPRRWMFIVAVVLWVLSPVPIVFLLADITHIKIEKQKMDSFFDSVSILSYFPAFIKRFPVFLH